MPAFKSLRKERWKKLIEEQEDIFDADQQKKPKFLRYHVPYRLAKDALLYKLGVITVALVLTTLTFRVPSTAVKDGDEIKNGYIQLAGVLLFCFIVALWSIQGTDPGYITVEGEVELEIDKESHTSHDINVAEETDLLLENDLSDDSDYYSDSEFELEFEPNEERDAEYSGVPVKQVPIRSKYCRQSGRFVAKYDHFCALINTTIGEKNHFRFLGFLIAVNILLVSGLVVSYSGIHDTKVSEWIETNAGAMLMTILMFLLLLCLGGLLALHCFFCCSNMSTYEFMRADKVSYLKDKKLREFDLPFSHGIVGNIKDFVFQDGIWYTCSENEWKPITWEIKPFARNSEDIYNNMWENKYYSCC